MKTRAKNMYVINGKIDNRKPRTNTFYKTDFFVSRGAMNIALWQRGKSEHYRGVPVGTQDIGIIYKGHFIKMFACNALAHFSMKENVKRLNSFMEKKNYNVFENAQIIIDKFKTYN